jgi:hypothetical protein
MSVLQTIDRKYVMCDPGLLEKLETCMPTADELKTIYISECALYELILSTDYDRYVDAVAYPEGFVALTVFRYWVTVYLRDYMNQHRLCVSIEIDRPNAAKLESMLLSRDVEPCVMLTCCGDSSVTTFRNTFEVVSLLRHQGFFVDLSVLQNPLSWSLLGYEVRAAWRTILERERVAAEKRQRRQDINEEYVRLLVEEYAAEAMYYDTEQGDIALERLTELCTNTQRYATLLYVPCTILQTTHNYVLQKRGTKAKTAVLKEAYEQKKAARLEAEQQVDSVLVELRQKVESVVEHARQKAALRKKRARKREAEKQAKKKDKRNLDNRSENTQNRIVARLFEAFASNVPESTKQVHRSQFEAFVRQQNYTFKVHTLWRIQKRLDAVKAASFKLKW